MDLNQKNTDSNSEGKHYKWHSSPIACLRQRKTSTVIDGGHIFAFNTGLDQVLIWSLGNFFRVQPVGVTSTILSLITDGMDQWKLVSYFSSCV